MCQKKERSLLDTSGSTADAEECEWKPKADEVEVCHTTAGCHFEGADVLLWSAVKGLKYDVERIAENVDRLTEITEGLAERAGGLSAQSDQLSAQTNLLSQRAKDQEEGLATLRNEVEQELQVLGEVLAFETKRCQEAILKSEDVQRQLCDEASAAAEAAVNASHEEPMMQLRAELLGDSPSSKLGALSKAVQELRASWEEEKDKQAKDQELARKESQASLRLPASMKLPEALETTRWVVPQWRSGVGSVSMRNLKATMPGCASVPMPHCATYHSGTLDVADLKHVRRELSAGARPRHTATEACVPRVTLLENRGSTSFTTSQREGDSAAGGAKLLPMRLTHMPNGCTLRA